jgi:hypothetical protein
MTVRAKFQCVGKNHSHQPAENVYCEIVLVPVWTGENGENASWSKATPNGRLTMGITNPAAIDTFDLGKFYYLDFTPAD